MMGKEDFDAEELREMNYEEPVGSMDQVVHNVDDPDWLGEEDEYAGHEDAYAAHSEAYLNLSKESEEDEDPFKGGLDTYTEDREGISDKVSIMNHVDKKFPHIEVTDLSGMQASSARILADSLKSGRLMSGIAYPVYYRDHLGQLLELGECHQAQVKMLIKLVGIENLLVRLTEEKELAGKLIYALSK